VYDISTIAVLFSWGALALLWAVMSLRGGRPQVVRRAGRDVLSRLAGGLGLAVILSPASLWRPIESGSTWPRAAGVVLLIAATCFTCWARVNLSGMWSSGTATREGHRLVTHGAYAVTRHPIYTGVIGMLAATTLAQGFGRWVAITACVSLVLAGKSRAEERLLIDVYPAAYREYTRAVPRMLPWRRYHPLQLSHDGRRHRQLR
jgi:protein-S-isoprenylcysteine O-methyltransferase Ste14